MRATQTDDPATFFAATESLRAAHPLLTNVFSTVAATLERGHAYPQAQWWLVHEGAAVVGAAMWTPPFPLACMPMPDPAAAALASVLASAAPAPPVIAGPEGVVAAVVHGLDPGHDLVPAMSETIYVLGALLPPSGVGGQARAAHESEIDALSRWHTEFAREAGLPALDRPDLLLQKVADRALWWWEHDGTPVSMAGHAPVVGTPGAAVGRIGPVYTPVPFRRRGYGAAVTAHVATLLQERCDRVTLFADDANPTSNGVYRRLGFTPTATWVEVPLAHTGRAPSTTAPTLGP